MEALSTYEAPIATRPQQSAALVEVESQRAMSEVQGAILLAKRFPRNEIECLDKIITACQRPGLAEQALYTYAKGGTEISGPSIRLMEAIAQYWGNLQTGIRELEQHNGVSTMEAFAWDMQTNVRQVKIFQVKHERHTKKGSYKLEDPREIYEQTANQAARRQRACLQGIIPGDIIDAAVAQSDATLKASADTSPEALKKLIEAFAAFKVTQGQIEKRIQRRIEAITPAQIIGLKKIYISLRDNMSGPADWFEPLPEAEPDKKPEATAAAALKNKLKGNGAKAADKNPPPPLPSLDAVKEVAEAAGKIARQLPPADPSGPMAPPVTMANSECPDNPGDIYTEQRCSVCKKRPTCPAWN